MHPIPLNAAPRATSYPSVYTLPVRPQDSKTTAGKDEPRNLLTTEAMHASPGPLSASSSMALGSAHYCSSSRIRGKTGLLQGHMVGRSQAVI